MSCRATWGCLAEGEDNYVVENDHVSVGDATHDSTGTFPGVGAAFPPVSPQVSVFGGKVVGISAPRPGIFGRHTSLVKL